MVSVLLVAVDAALLLVWACFCASFCDSGLLSYGFVSGFFADS